MKTQMDGIRLKDLSQVKQPDYRKGNTLVSLRKEIKLLNLASCLVVLGDYIHISINELVIWYHLPFTERKDPFFFVIRPR